MTNDEINKSAAELDGWDCVVDRGGARLTGRKGNMWGIIPEYSMNAEETKRLIRETCTTPELRAKFMNALHRLVEPLCTKNKAGSPVVSDFDKLVAPTELWLKALLIATGKLPSQTKSES